MSRIRNLSLCGMTQVVRNTCTMSINIPCRLLDSFYKRTPSYWLPGTRRMITVHMYQPRTYVLEPEKQARYLTKALLQPGLPQTFQNDLKFPPETVNSIMHDFEESIIQASLFYYIGEKSTEPLDPYPARSPIKWRKLKKMQQWRATDQNTALKLFLNFMRIAWTRSDDRYPMSMNSTVSYEPYVSASFQRNDLNIQIGGKYGMLLMSDKPPETFAPDRDILESADEEIVWDDVISPAFHMFEKSNTNFRTIKSFRDGAPYPHPHTLFIVHTGMNKTSQLVGHGIMYSFAQAFSMALSNPNNVIGTDKIEPVPIQCVITDGKRMSFVCFQLNTLNFKDDLGTKNFVWIEPGLTMFEEAKLDTSEESNGDISLVGFNRYCFELFLKFVLNY